MPTGLCHASPDIAGRNGRRPARLDRHGDEAAVIWRILPANRLPYRVDRDPLGDALGHRPAHELAGEGACHGRKIEPPFPCGYVCDVAHPKPVAPVHGESAFYQVQPRVSRLGLLLDAAFSGRAPSGKPGLPHDAEHALLALSGRWASSGRDARRNRISRPPSARMPS